MTAWLEMASGVRIPLHAVCTIGRSPKNTLVLNDAAISRRHALVHAQGAGEYWVVDLGSNNGVNLNGQRVKQPVALKDRDRLEIVGNTFVFRQVKEAPEESAQQDTIMFSRRDVRTAQLWLLVADIIGSTELSRKLTSDEFSQTVGGWFATCREIVEEYGGIVSKYLGDGFLAYWPDPQAAGDLLAKALDELKARQATRSPAFRLAVHFGSATLDKTGASSGGDLVGPDVSFVFQMEILAGQLSETCLASEAAAQRLRGAAQLAEVGKHPLGGFEGAYSFFRF